MDVYSFAPLARLANVGLALQLRLVGQRHFGIEYKPEAQASERVTCMFTRLRFGLVFHGGYPRSGAVQLGPLDQLVSESRGSLRDPALVRGSEPRLFFFERSLACFAMTSSHPIMAHGCFSVLQFRLLWPNLPSPWQHPPRASGCVNDDSCHIHLVCDWPKNQTSERCDNSWVAESRRNTLPWAVVNSCIVSSKR